MICQWINSSADPAIRCNKGAEFRVEFINPYTHKLTVVDLCMQHTTRMQELVKVDKVEELK